MGTPTDLVADVIRGNLAGAEEHIKAATAKRDEAQADVDRFTEEAAEYRRLLEHHEKAVLH